MVQLPPEFKDLQPYAEVWDLPSAHDRYQRRKMMQQSELAEFYTRALPMMERMLGHLDGFDIYDLSPSERLLYRLLCGLCEASAAIELIGAPYVVPPEGHDLVYRDSLPVL